MGHVKSRFLAVITIPVLLFTGCVQQQQEELYSEPVIIDVYDSCSDFEGMQEGWYARILNDKFNIQLNFLDDSKEAMAQADLLICERAKVNPDSLMEEGLLLNIEPYLEMELPEATSLSGYRSSFEVWNEPFAQGGIYVLPSQVSGLSELTPSEEKVPLYGFYINWEEYTAYIDGEGLFERIGTPEVKDHEELLEVLEEMLERRAAEAQTISVGMPQAISAGTPQAALESDVAGIVLCNDETMDLLDHVAYVCGTMGYELDGLRMYSDEGREYEELLADDGGLKQGIDWLRQAYKKGLIPEESLDYTVEEMKAYYEDGRALLQLWPGYQAAGYELLPMEEYKVISHGCNPEGTLDVFLAIGAGTEVPERLVDFVGWLYSPEGIMLSAVDTQLKAAGPEGLTWEVVEGTPTLTEFGKRVLVQKEDVQVSDAWGGDNWRDGSCKLNFQPVVSVEVSPSGYAYNYTLWDTTDAEFGTASRSWRELTGVQNAMEYLIDQNKLAVIPGFSDLAEQSQEDEIIEIVDNDSSFRQVIVDSIRKMICAETREQYEELWEELHKNIISVQRD